MMTFRDAFRYLEVNLFTLSLSLLDCPYDTHIHKEVVDYFVMCTLLQNPLGFVSRWTQLGEDVAMHIWQELTKEFENCSKEIFIAITPDIELQNMIDDEDDMQLGDRYHVKSVDMKQLFDASLQCAPSPTDILRYVTERMIMSCGHLSFDNRDSYAMVAHFWMSILLPYSRDMFCAEYGQMYGSCQFEEMLHIFHASLRELSVFYSCASHASASLYSPKLCSVPDISDVNDLDRFSWI